MTWAFTHSHVYSLLLLLLEGPFYVSLKGSLTRICSTWEGYKSIWKGANGFAMGYGRFYLVCAKRTTTHYYSLL